MKNAFGNLYKKIGLVVALVFACSFVSLAEDTAQFVPGTTINGIGVGGMTVDGAKARIEGFYASDYKLVIKELGGARETISGAEIGFVVTVTDGMQTILDEQNATGRNSGPAVDNSHTVQTAGLFDEGALAAKINALDCISGSAVVVTADAKISAYQAGQPFVIIPEVQGNNVDVEKVTALLKGAVAAGTKEVDLSESGCYYTVAVNSANEPLIELCRIMNQCREMAITYTFGNASETLAGETICTWLTGSEGGQIAVSRDAAVAYIKTLADKYNTAGRARTFRTTNGADKSLSGAYGWKIDQAAETDALIGMIRTGQTQAREPKYSQSAASRTLPDWGNTYVEIDLAGQHVYLYKNGAMVWDAPCVTGNVSKKYTTPDGIYSLYYKQTDRVLRGAKQADGTYEYESPVKYWMPFNNGIGLHDADWRSKFGGSIYKSGGSHGCINLPPSKTKALYDLVYAGIPVICHD